MKRTSKPLAILIVILMFGGIFFSKVQGWWETESTKEAAVYTEGEFEGQANPADIRGSYTFGDVENNFKVPAELLVQAFGVQTDDPAAFPVKSLEEMYLTSPQEVGTASVRLFVAFYLGLPFDLSTDIYLPQSAAEILYASDLNLENRTYLDNHIVPDLNSEILLSTPQPEETLSEGEVPVSTEEHEPIVEEGTIKGKTTFAELLDWGVDAKTIESILGMSLPTTFGQTVRDFCTQNGLSFETIKTDLQVELDKLN
ncbi:MAG: hypothetical protein IH585_03980 [Anaerolineaceae bacterium]|nr:hypothetical protein [Anaerolineaceae bacterium]